MTETTQVIEDLARRVQALEDEHAIHRTLVRYGFAVDSNDAEALVTLYTDDTRHRDRRHAAVPRE